MKSLTNHSRLYKLTLNFKVLDHRDSLSTSELVVKMAFLMLLFNDQLYLMDSETALERGYADLTIIVRSTMRQYRV